MKAIWLTGLFSAALVLDARPQGVGDLTTNSGTDLAQQLFDACSHDNLDAVKKLLDQGAPIDAHVGVYQTTPLIAASNYADVTRSLIARGAGVNLTDSAGDTALLQACYYNHPDVAQALLDAKADPNIANQGATTPLSRAASNGDDALVTLLLSRGANLNANGDAGPSTWRAAEANHLSTLKLLVDAGADLTLKPVPVIPSRRSWSLLGCAADDQRIEVMDFLLTHGVDVNDAGANGVTAFMQAAGGDQMAVVNELLAKGAKLAAQSDTGWNALMFAAKDAQAPMLQKLLDEHADIESKNKDGQTALIIAAQNGNAVALNFLVDQGANVNATDSRGETALTWAGNVGCMDLVQILANKGAGRTEVHVISQPPSVPPLSVPRAWALAVSALYVQHNYANPHVLGGMVDPERAADMMRHDWDIRGSRSLTAVLDGLQAKKESAKMIDYGQKITQLTEDQFSQLIAREPNREVTLNAIRAGYWKWQDRLGVAWDLCRAANLINLGYDAGYINEQDAWARLRQIAADTRTTFNSWKEMADNFVDGRAIVQGRNPRFDALEQLLSNPQETNSPWNQIPWATDLLAQ
jgi:ankyrin repeat protein